MKACGLILGCAVWVAEVVQGGCCISLRRRVPAHSLAKAKRNLKKDPWKRMEVDLYTGPHSERMPKDCSG